MIKIKPYFFFVILLIASMLSSVAFINYLVDPFYVYNVRGHNNYYYGQRYTNPGLARNIDYDTAIIGSSHTENTLGSYVSSVMNVKALKLSMADATAYEYKLLLDVVLGRENTKNIIWGLDYFSFLGDDDRVSEGGSFPYHLFDIGMEKFFKYTLSKDTLENSLRAITDRGIIGIDNLNTWNDPNSFGRDKLIYAFENECRHPRTILRNKLIPESDIKSNVEKNLKNIIASRPDVKFKLFLPSYSAAYHVFIRDYSPALFNAQLEFRYLLEQLNEEMENVELYDFQQLPLTQDDSLYLDLTHYNRGVNELLIDYIDQGEYLVEKGYYSEVAFLEYLSSIDMNLPAINLSCEIR